MKALAPPLFESALLHNIASAIERRGKAIRYHGRLECSRNIEDSSERLNIDFAAILRFRVRLSVWANGVFWLGITMPGSRRAEGLAHRSEAHGHLGGLEADDVLERIEKTILSPAQAQTFWPTSDESGNA